MNDGGPLIPGYIDVAGQTDRMYKPGVTLRAWLAGQAIAGVDCVSCPNSLESIAIRGAGRCSDSGIGEIQVTRTKIGSIATDTASLLLIDPFQALRRPEWVGTDCQSPAYDELTELRFPSQPEEVKALRKTAISKLGTTVPLSPEERSALLAQPLRHEPIVPFHGGLAISIDSDGWYDVYAEYDDHGMARIVIELTGDPDED